MPAAGVKKKAPKEGATKAVGDGVEDVVAVGVWLLEGHRLVLPNTQLAVVHWRLAGPRESVPVKHAPRPLYASGQKPQPRSALHDSQSDAALHGSGVGVADALGVGVSVPDGVPVGVSDGVGVPVGGWHLEASPYCHRTGEHWPPAGPSAEPAGFTEAHREMSPQ